jgi:DNA-binding response OmpR family regulator
MNNSILLIEDDISLGPALKGSLESEGYQVTLCPTLNAARETQFADYDLILLDWMLPDGQGIDLLKEINTKVPTIMLTARTDLIDKVIGLEAGANDYITKPFEPRELLARIRVQLRTVQKGSESEDILETQNLILNRIERSISYKGQKLILTKMEFDLLFLLIAAPKQVFTREKLLDEVWGYENYPTTRTVDNHVLQIRQKISTDVIETVRGIGYKFNPEHN